MAAKIRRVTRYRLNGRDKAVPGGVRGASADGKALVRGSIS